MSNLLQRSYATGWHKSVNRSAIVEVLRSHQLIETLKVSGDGRIEVTSAAWEDYWGSAQAGLTSPQAQQLQVLESARIAYIASGHDLTAAPAYCQTYFAFLRDLLSGPTDEDALRALLGLESFAITWWADHRALAAGALTIRHPVYLLAKLREPRAYENPKFLPLVYPHGGAEPGSASLFYNYRQIKIQDDPSASLLVYPAVDVCRRTESFTCIEAVSAALSFKPDLRSRQRATTICDWAIAPFLKHPAIKANARTELAFVDIGGGSGALLSEICKRLIKNHREMLADRKFAWSIIDLGLQDATRRTCSPELRQHMSYIDYQPADYITWITEESARTDLPKSDVVLICRLLNNLSHIDIEYSSASDVIAELMQVRGKPLPTDFHPADCLRGPDPDCASLIASNAMARLLGGTTFRQASLREYYWGLHRISNSSQTTPQSGQSLFFPLRRFNKAALLLSDGSSILERLGRLTSLIVIEDIDLTAEILCEHLQTHRLHNLTASDATDRVRMQSANLLCITRRELEATLPGRRIW